MIFILIKNNIVENVITAKQVFIDSNPELYDIAIGVHMSDRRPSPRDIYDPETETFSSPIEDNNTDDLE